MQLAMHALHTSIQSLHATKKALAKSEQVCFKHRFKCPQRLGLVLVLELCISGLISVFA